MRSFDSLTLAQDATRLTFKRRFALFQESRSGFKNLGVLDISGVALGKARERLGHVADSVKWFETDVAGFRDERRWDVWHDRAVFHFLTASEDRRAYGESLERNLKTGGHVVVSTFAPDGPDKCSGLEVQKYDSESIVGAFGSRFQLLDSRAEKHETPDGVSQNFVYSLLRYR